MDTNSSEVVFIDVSAPPANRIKKPSMVWEHFTLETVSRGISRACCNHCNKSFAYKTGWKVLGTSHLKRHIELGVCAKSRESLEVENVKEETTSCPPVKRRRASPNQTAPNQTAPNVPLDQYHCNHEMAKMIIMHDYPLHMVEHPGFVGFVQALRPQFSVASFNTIRGDCVNMFLSQKQKLLDLIGEIPGGVNLTVDLWSSNKSVGYAFVTGHLIDKNWNLTHLLLNVVAVASPDSDRALNQPVAACLSDWKLEGKITSLAVCQSLVDKISIDNLRGFLSVKNQHVLNGQFLMVKCYARLLSSMAQDLLTVEQLQEPLKKVRDSIKYVNTNEACKYRFNELKGQFPTFSSNKDLLIDNQTRWDTSYNMLLAACEHRLVFSSLETFHPEYKLSISPDEWRKIESVCSCLKVLFEASNYLTGPSHLTANDLYHEMTKLQLELSHVGDGEDPDVRNLSNLLREEFDQYWRGCFLVLAVAVVMDPRFKMHLVKFSFTKSYCEDADEWIKSVDDAVHDLYLNYSEQNLLDAYVNHGFSEAESAQELHFHQDNSEDVITGNEQSGDETSPQVEQSTESHQHERQPRVRKQNEVGLCEGASEVSQLTEKEQQDGDDYQAHVMVEEDHTSFSVDELLEEGSTLVTIGESLSDLEMFEMKNELDQYLEDSLIPRSEDFNVLSWWRDNTNNYPTLSKMAADLLSIPFTTVSSDSVFDTEVKQMDNYRTSLPHVTLEALLCTKDWFKNGII